MVIEQFKNIFVLHYTGVCSSCKVVFLALDLLEAQIEAIKTNRQRLNLTEKDVSLMVHDFSRAKDDVIRWFRHVGMLY